jgi:hypothetical protein
MNEIVPYSEQQIQAVAKGIAIIDNELNKKFMLSIVDNCKVVPIDRQSAVKLRRQIKLRKIDKVVLAKGEDINQKLTGVYSSLHHFGATLLVYLHGTKKGVELFFGVKGTDGKNASDAIDILEKSLDGNFPGSKIVEVDDINKIEFLEECIPIDEAVKTISTLYAVPSLQDSENKTDTEKYVQGIEKFIDTMAGEEYTAMFICEPINRNRLQKYKRDLEQFYTDLSMIDQFELTYGSNENNSISETVGKNMATTIGNSTSMARSHGESHSNGGGSGSTSGGSFLGSNWSNNQSTNWNDSWNNSQTENDTQQESRTDGTNVANTIAITTGSSKSYSSTVEIKPVIEYMKKIEGLLARIEKAESYGMWETAGYFIATDANVSRIGAAAYKSLLSGESSYLEPSLSNVWDWNSANYEKQNQIAMILKHLHCGNHPVFRENSYDNQNNTEFSYLRASNLVSGSELPIFVGLPRKSVAGVTMLSYAEFGRNVIKEKDSGKRRFELGSVYHMGKYFESERIDITVNTLSQHCFICGTPGAGKSNTVYHILENLVNLTETDTKKDGSYKAAEVSFLIIEPKKGEYKNDLGGLPDINIYTTNPHFNKMLRLNPFSFPEEIHVLEHLDRLIEIFSACWPLYAAMPAVLKETFEHAYREIGWDLKNSVYLHSAERKFPTFKTVLNLLPRVIDNYDFGVEARGNYKGALETRVKSLTTGIIGMIFSEVDDAIDDEVLFNRNTIVDISRVGSDETRSLIMGILVLKLNEFRMCENLGSNLPLRHVTVIEEAHNLLKRVSTDQNQEGANITGKSVEMITNSIAEMRTYGEGFIIIDQTPSAVAESAISNTSTKIIMRLSEFSDCNTMGKSVSLNENQIKEISRLNQGVAVVFQSDWEEAVLCQIDEYKGEQYKIKDFPPRELSAQRKADAQTALKTLSLWKEKDIVGLSLLPVISSHKTAFKQFLENCRTTVAITSFVSIVLDGENAIDTFRHILPSKLEMKKDTDGKLILTADGYTQFNITKEMQHQMLKFYDSVCKYIQLFYEIPNESIFECVYCIFYAFLCKSKARSERHLREFFYMLCNNEKHLKSTGEKLHRIEKEVKK